MLAFEEKISLIELKRMQRLPWQLKNKDLGSTCCEQAKAPVLLQVTNVLQISH